MGEVKIVPRIRCDNCGFVAEKVDNLGRGTDYSRPRGWGSARIDDGRRSGYPEHIAFTDLCPDCAKAISDAAGKAAQTRRAALTETAPEQEEGKGNG